MSTRALVTVAIVLMVALAGCGGTSEGPGDGTEAPASTPTATDVGATSPADETDTPSGDDETDAPTDDGSSGAVQALESHGDSLDGYEGVVADMTMTSDTPEGSVEMTGTFQQDFGTDEMYSDFEMEFDGQTSSFQQYQPPGSDTLYQCFIYQGSCTQQQTSSVENEGLPDAESPVNTTTALGEYPDFEDEGLVQTDDGQFQLYVAEGVDAIPDSDQDTDWESFNVELYFEPDSGLLRQYVYEATFEEDGETYTTTMTATYDYGSVDVQPPDWYDGS